MTRGFVGQNLKSKAKAPGFLGSCRIAGSIPRVISQEGKPGGSQGTLSYKILHYIYLYFALVVIASLMFFLSSSFCYLLEATSWVHPLMPQLSVALQLGSWGCLIIWYPKPIASPIRFPLASSVWSISICILLYIYNIYKYVYLVGGLEHFLLFHILGMSSSQLTFMFF